MYVDADFAGLWGVEPTTSPISVKSCTGFVIALSGCYVLSKSCLQSSIAQSTGEAEYIALSNSLQALLPIRHALSEILNSIRINDDFSTAIESKFKGTPSISGFQTLVHEDNNSALMLATLQRVTNLTKHYAVKLHWFWSVVNEESNRISVIKIDTHVQRADYLTKGMPTPGYQSCRKLTQGW